MKTTLELPDSLMREVKVRAAQSDRTLTDLVAELLRVGLDQTPTRAAVKKRADFPLIVSSRPAREVSPEELAAMLNDQDVTSAT